MGCNDGGRPKKYHQVLHVARLAGPEAVKTLARCMRDETAPWPVRVLAANSLLDRGFGKPKERVVLETPTGAALLRIEIVDTNGDREMVTIDQPREATEYEQPEGRDVLLSFDRSDSDEP